MITQNVLVCLCCATVLQTAGTGREGTQDGPVDAATLRETWGLALIGARLYVTANHCVCEVDLTASKTLVKGLDVSKPQTVCVCFLSSCGAEMVRTVAGNPHKQGFRDA